MNMHVSAPALQAEAPPTPAPMVQDWEQLVSPGHVLRDRLIERSKGGFLKATAAALGAIFLMSFSSEAFTIARYVTAPAGLLMTDPLSYTDLGDGVRVPYWLDWLAAVPAQGGLSVTAFDQLHEAVQMDVAMFGADAASWQQTAELGIAPRITRPARMFETDAQDRLSTGVVGVPETAGQPISLVAFVDGRLRWSVIEPGRCALLLGPQREGCFGVVRSYRSNEELAIFDSARPRGE